MKNNKKGLSTIVATLLIILLTLVAIGIIWIVIRGVVENSTQQLDINSKCLATEVVATKVTNSSPVANWQNYTVVINRRTGDDVIGGVKLVFTNAGGSISVVRDMSGDLATLQSRQYYANITTSELSNPNKVSIVVYYLDDSGVQQLCQTASELKFA
jgi:hypothetical protein